jgi:hypothetical protein
VDEDILDILDRDLGGAEEAALAGGQWHHFRCCMDGPGLEKQQGKKKKTREG